MKQDLVSIIVPVFNTELYLRRCMTSILNQTYDNIEVIAIDDGSTDNSGRICDLLALEDKRIKVVHQRNQGSGVARNTGLKMINGEYLIFVDSDDIIASNMLEQMVESIKKNDTDLVAVGLRFITEKEEIVSLKNPNDGSALIKNKNDLVVEMLQGKHPVSIVNKIYRSSIVLHNKIRFQEKYRFWEDLDFNISYLEKTEKKVIDIKNDYYFAIIRQGSQTRQSDNFRDFELVESTRYIYNLLKCKKEWPDIVKIQAGVLLSNVLITFFFHGGVFPETNKGETRRIILKETSSFAPYLSAKKKTQYILIKLFPYAIKLLSKSI